MIQAIPLQVPPNDEVKSPLLVAVVADSAKPIALALILKGWSEADCNMRSRSRLAWYLLFSHV